MSVARPLAARSVLVLGGARSGKSGYAQALVEAAGRRRTMIATGQAGDAEMAARIARHRAERGPSWSVREEPLALVEALSEEARPDRAVLVDCLTLWLANLLFADLDPEAEGGRLAAIVSVLEGPAVFVSNEVGAGIVPDNALARTFRDAQGRLNQAMAEACDAVVLVTAGLPQLLKPSHEPRLVLATLLDHPASRS